MKQRILFTFLALCMALIILPGAAMAYNTGDDYPSRYKEAEQDTVVDEWNFYNRECTSFVAWCLNSRNGVHFTNQYLGVSRWGHAREWGDTARSVGISVDNTPAVGSVAWWNTGEFGHVAWVSAVNGDNITIEEYNSWPNYYAFQSRTISKNDVSGFIHIADLNAIAWDGFAGTFDESTGTLTISGNGCLTSPHDSSCLYQPVYIENKITRIVLQNGIADVDKNVFAHFTNLTSVVLPGSMTRIADYMFSYCDKLTDVSIPSSVTSIGTCAFTYCDALTNITIPSSVTNIDDYAFEHCANLTTIMLPNTLTHMGRGIVSLCPKLEHLDIPSSITTIPDGAFSNCTGLRSITLPNSITSIEPYAFSYCDNLTDIQIPSSVVSIGHRAFEHCTSLENITVPATVTDLDDSVFTYCSGLKNVTLQNSALPSGTFTYCTSLTSISIPASVVDIDFASGNMFLGCSNLREINVDSQNPNLFSQNGVLFARNKKDPSTTRLVTYPCAKSGTYTIPSHVTEIGSGSFSGCTKLTSVKIPSSVKDFGSSAFKDCTGLMNVEFSSSGWGSGKNYLGLGGHTFAGCTKLTSIAIPYGFTQNSAGCFSGCTSLISVSIPSTYRLLDVKTFENCSSLTDIFYGGSKSDWDQLRKLDGNDVLQNVTVHYNSNSSNGTWQTIQSILKQAGKRFVTCMGFRCPVDVAVYAPNSQLAGSVIGNVADIKLADQVYIEVFGDEKYVFLLDDAEYTVKLTGTDDGTMTYTVQNMDVESWAVTGEQTFAQVALTNGKQFVSTVKVEDSVAVDVETKEVKLYVVDSNGSHEKEVLPDGRGTEVPITTPDVPNNPNQPDKPDVPSKPSTPPTPSNSSTHFTPSIPSPPTASTTPAAPSAEDEPEESVPSEPAPADVSLPFTDVFPANWFYSSVQYVYANGLMTGTTATEFSPAASMTRAMVWMVLGRMAGADVNGTGGEWYAKAQAWASTSGVSDGSNPNGDITREELVTMLWRFAGSSAVNADLSGFSDSASVSGWAVAAVRWAAAKGILGGDNGALKPAASATRAEVAAILMRFCENA